MGWSGVGWGGVGWGGVGWGGVGWGGVGWGGLGWDEDAPSDIIDFLAADQTSHIINKSSALMMIFTCDLCIDASPEVK